MSLLPSNQELENHIQTTLLSSAAPKGEGSENEEGDLQKLKTTVEALFPQDSEIKMLYGYIYIYIYIYIYNPSPPLVIAYIYLYIYIIS